uniref:SH2B adapter protein 2 n=1 Tax=Elaeophora elaphi TaxID=1147741 RepID=A0A0R3RXU3_9BILA
MEAQESDRWRQFCIQYAKSVAFKFAESWQQYSTSAGITQSTVSISDIIQQFTNTLSEELTERLATPNVILPVITFLPTNASSNRTTADNVSYRERSCDWRSLNEYERPASIADITWLSRSRSEMASKGRSMLVDSTVQHQPASSNSTRPSIKRLSWFRSHFQAKTTVELIREGNVKYMSGLELETKQWRKCRLCLVKTAGGYLLEFYSPPKNSRAKSGIFCFLIMEVRETTPLEFEEGNESIFVIRGYNDVEYVIEAKNPDDCQQWLGVIRGCVSENDANSTHRFVRQPSAPPIGSSFLRNRQFFSTRSLNNVHSMGSIGMEARIPIRTVRDSVPSLEIYPWFHARLSRSVSARLVLHNGVDGHGLFLVRRSETRPGEFVLTFNCQGKAKHVRVVMMPDGECRIHQMIFETMIDLLEYFRDNPIPLESSSTPPILLNEYVICWRRRSLASLDLDVRDFLTYAGSVRLDIRALEDLVRHEQHDRQHRTTALSNSYRYQ